MNLTYDILIEEHPEVATIEDNLVGYEPERGLKYRRIIDYGNNLYGFYYYKTLDGKYTEETSDLYPTKRVNIFTHEYRFEQKETLRA